MAAPLLARSSLLHPAAPPLGSLTAAGAPLIDAEDLFRQTEPAQFQERFAKQRKLLVSLQPSETFGGFLHSGSGPAQGHGRRAPALHVPADAPHRRHHILDNVGTGEPAPQLLWQSEPRDGEDFFDPLQDRTGDP